jgi:WD40 repeat protein
LKNLGTFSAEDHILHLAWSADGTRLLATPTSGSILVAGTDAQILETLPGHGMGNGESAWFLDQPVTCGFDGKVRTGSREWSLGRGLIERVKASADGKFLGAAQGKALHIFDAEGNDALSLRDLEASVVDFAWNPSRSREVATVGAGGATLWRLGQKKLFARFDWGGASLRVGWSADGRWLATGDQTPSVHVYDIPRDHPLHIQGFEGKVQALAFSKDSRQLATAGSAVVTVWPMTGKKGPDGATPIQIDGCEAPAQALDFSSNGQLAIGDGAGTLLVITFEKGQFRRKRSKFEGGISSLAWHPSLPLLAIGHEDGRVMLLSLE